MSESETPKDDAHLLELAALITQSVQTVLAEYGAAKRSVPGLDSTDPSAALLNRPVREAVRVLESACAQLCASVAPAQHTMVNVRTSCSPWLIPTYLNYRTAVV